MKRVIVLAGVCLTGCAGGFTGGNRINTAALRSSDAVPFAEIVQNIRCDLQAFLTDSKDVPAFSMGGLITATVSTNYVQTNGIGASVPVAPTLEIGLSAKRTNAQTFGLLTKQAIIVYRDAKAEGEAEKPIDCTAYNEAGDSRGSSATKLSGPLLNLREMRRQLEAIPKGSPHLRLPGFRITGSILLVKGTEVGGGIRVYFISAEAANTTSASYKIDFDLATNWKPLLTDYVIAPPKAPEPPASNVVYVIQATEPPKRDVRKPETGRPKDPPIPDAPGEWLRQQSKLIPMIQAASEQAQRAAAEKAAASDPSAPKPDVPK